MKTALTRRNMIATAGALVGATAFGASNAAVSMTAEERVEHHAEELRKAWEEAFGPLKILAHDGTDGMNRHMFFVSDPGGGAVS